MIRDNLVMRRVRRTPNLLLIYDLHDSTAREFVDRTVGRSCHSNKRCTAQDCVTLMPGANVRRYVVMLPLGDD